MNVMDAPDASPHTQLWKPVGGPGGLCQLGNRASGLALWVPGDSYLGTADTKNVVEVPASWSGDDGIWSIAA